MSVKTGQAHPTVPLHSGDLRDFTLAGRFDAITCLFSAIGYVQDVEELHRGVAAMAGHLNPGGVLIIEPWFTREQWREGTVGHTVVEAGRRRIIRVSHGSSMGRTSTMHMHYLIADPGSGIRHFQDDHVMTLFTEDEYRSAFTMAGCGDLALVPGWPDGRARLVGVFP